MKGLKQVFGILSLTGGLLLGGLAAGQAAPVDVTKDGWWLTPYKASKQWTIGVSYTDVSISYIAALQRAVQSKAKEMGVKIIEVDAKNDTNIELANVENLLQQHIDLLLLEGASLKASVASIEAANKANVPVVHFNILAEGGQYVTFVGSNQLESGQLMGKKIVELYKSAGKDKLKGIYMRGIAGYITDEVRNQGVKDTLKEAGIADKIEWTEQYADFSRAKAQSVAESILRQVDRLRLHHRQRRRHDPRRPRRGEGGRPRRQDPPAQQRRRSPRDARRHQGRRHRFDRVPERRRPGAGRHPRRNHVP
ncbi:MAG TPA: sugar ABC transporter substrate-binding protein [Bauldia sp.]|nr:sugar ABC transporter substrate-binding protein [Bauldia sp.]